jgi:CRISPR-associated endonuclease/helicase Cas3
MDEIYAKWDERERKTETLRMHTEHVKQEMMQLRQQYPHSLSPRLWDLLAYAVTYHDAGKVYEGFQQTIRARMGEDVPITLPYIPHAYLSILFLPFTELQLTPQETWLLTEAVAYHHERNKEIDWKRIEQVLPQLQEKVTRLEEELQAPIRSKLQTRGIITKRMSLHHEDYPLLVKVKGLLNRVDHAASAGQAVEYHHNYHIGTYVDAFLHASGHHKRPLQQFAYENRNENIIAVAQTGMGKTEAALYWIDRDKACITLPVRVSLNALYERITNTIGYVDAQNCPIAGLLHSNSLAFLQEMEDDYDNNEIAYEQSRLLSRKLTCSTIDQILKFPFLFRGYEKYIATLSYAKIVLDEIQGYAPEILAVLLKAVEMIHNIGGRFMIMTATMPTIFIEELRRRGHIKADAYRIQSFFDESKRHHLQICDRKLEDDLPLIQAEAIQKRVLIIVNTIKEAKHLHSLLEADGARILHTHFIQKHRAQLEQEIKAFAPNDKNRTEAHGIWITTQLVEASLDIDFDVLFTEMSTLDSLFQRCGRCYRSREYEGTEPNVYVYTKASGIGTVYNKHIAANSLQLLQKHTGVLAEQTKQKLVEQLYQTENVGTEYLRTFRNALQVLDHMQPYNLSSKQAQQLLRKIDSYTVIPASVYEENQQLFQQFAASKDRKQRRLLRLEIEQLTMSVSRWWVEKEGIELRDAGVKGVYVGEVAYG